MRLGIFLISAFYLAFSPSVSRAADSVTLPNCLLALDEEAQIPAQEEGALTKIAVREGQQVAAGDLLAQLDDSIPRSQYNVAYYKLKAAEREARDDINIRYAQASAKVAEAEYLQAVEANEKVPGAVPLAEVRQRLLKWEEMKLSIEKAQKEIAVAGLQMEVAKAELAANKTNVERRQLLAPLDAVVIELTRHEGEWAQKGEPIMRVVRMDRLRVEGFLNAKDFRESDIQGRPVRVVVPLAGGGSEAFQGKIVYVKPTVEAGGEFLVRAEVQNRKENGVWVLRPGVNAEMTIQLR